MPWRIRGLSGACVRVSGQAAVPFVSYVLGHAVEGPYHYYARYPTAPFAP